MIDKIKKLEQEKEELKDSMIKAKAAEDLAMREHRRLLNAMKYVSNELYRAYITGDIGAKDEAIRKVMLRADKEIGDEY